MAPTHVLIRVRPGMAVRTADGHTLGKVTQIWYGSDPIPTQPYCDDEVCSRLEVQPGGFGRRPVYVPYSAVLDVTARRVILQVDAASVNQQAWHRQPAWIAAAAGVRRTRWATWDGRPPGGA